MNRQTPADYVSPNFKTVFADCESGFCLSGSHEGFTEQDYELDWE